MGSNGLGNFIQAMKPVLAVFPATNFRDLLQGCWISLGGPACVDTYTRKKTFWSFFDKVTEVLDGGGFDRLYNFRELF